MNPLSALLAPLTRRTTYPSRGTRVGSVTTNISLAVPGATLRGWVVNPGQQRAVIYLGGNAEPIERRREALTHRLHDHTSYLVSYRGYGASSGRPTQARLTRDAVTIFDHVVSLHTGGTVDVIGRSLGTGVAVQLAVRRPVHRLVLITPFDSAAGVAKDLVPRFPSLALADTWNSSAAAPNLTCPVLVVGAGQDAVVLPARTDALVAALAPTTRVVSFPDADHGSIIDEPTLWPTVAQFLEG